MNIPKFSNLRTGDFMSILHVIMSVDLRSGGPIEGILQQSKHRPADRFSVNIASLDRFDDPVVTECPVPTIALGDRLSPAQSWRRWLPWVKYGYQPRMAPWLKRNVANYDIVIVNGLWNYSTLAARRALVGSGIPYVVFTHGMLDPWFKKAYPIKSLFKQLFWLFCEGPLLNGANAVFFTTEDERETSRNAFWPYRVRERVVGYGTADVTGNAETQEAAFRATLPVLGERPYLLYLSRIHPKKGCDLLIDAFAEVASLRPDLDLVFAGPDQTGWRPELEARAHMRGLSGRIHWPGMIKGDVKWGAYRGCDAFVLPSHQENFGIVVAEALACGRPVLISNKVQIWREVEAGGGGLVEADDAEGTVRLLQRFLALDAAARSGMGAAAREIFLDKFEISRAAKTINAALKEVIREHFA